MPVTLLLSINLICAAGNAADRAFCPCYALQDLDTAYAERVQVGTDRACLVVEAMTGAASVDSSWLEKERRSVSRSSLLRAHGNRLRHWSCFARRSFCSHWSGRLAASCCPKTIRRDTCLCLGIERILERWHRCAGTRIGYGRTNALERQITIGRRRCSGAVSIGIALVRLGAGMPQTLDTGIAVPMSSRESLSRDSHTVFVATQSR